jgi:hypothetical protein
MGCALCQQNKQLCDSHIVPEFMYQHMYDANHRFRVLSRNEVDATRFLRKGLREELLCRDCEAKFSKWESYA